MISNKTIPTETTEPTITKVGSITSDIFFWNIKQKNLSEVIKKHLETKQYNILFFSETTQKIRGELNQLLLSLGFKARTQISEGNVRVALFDNFDDANIIFVKEERRNTMIIYEFDGVRYMVVGVHLDSPASYPEQDDRYVRATETNTLISTYKEIYSVKKIVLIGDFNLNPFDKGMVSELSFKATHCKKTAQSNTSAKEYLFNPSWKSFSNDLTESTKKPPGTIHYVPRNKDTYVDYWHVFDQVLISPQLFSKYSDSFEILTEWNEVNLLNEALTPDKINYSDHLPIAYKFQIGREV